MQVGTAQPGDLTIKQVADYLRIDQSYVGKLIHAGLLDAKKVPGRGRTGQKRIPTAAVLRFLSAATERAAA